VHITYRINPDYDPVHPESKILKEVHYYILEEKDHDTFYVQHAFMLNWEFLQSRGYFPNQHVVWNDGCNESTRCWYFLPHYHNLTNCEELQSSY
jgi:hypothetical protein